MVSHSYRSQNGTRVPNLDSWQIYNIRPGQDDHLFSVRSVVGAVTTSAVAGDVCPVVM
jgi:hypothetical protein